MDLKDKAANSFLWVFFFFFIKCTCASQFPLSGIYAVVILVCALPFHKLGRVGLK